MEKQPKEKLAYDQNGVGWPTRGRPPKDGEKAMSAAERQRQYRQRLKDQGRHIPGKQIPGKVKAGLELARLHVEIAVAALDKLRIAVDAEGLPPGHEVRKALSVFELELREVRGLVSERYTGTIAEWRRDLGYKD